MEKKKPIRKVSRSKSLSSLYLIILLPIGLSITYLGVKGELPWTERNIHLRGEILEGHVFGAIDLTAADMSFANLNKADLRETKLIETDLHGAELKKADLHSVKLIRTDLREANMSRAKLLGANLGEAMLMNTILDSADLTSANLTKANLAGASLRGAILSDAVLDSADLQKTNLKGAKGLTVEQLPKVKTLFEADLDSSLRTEIIEDYSHLFDNPDTAKTNRISSKNPRMRR